MSKKVDKITGIIVFLLGIFIVWESYQLGSRGQGMMTNISFWPKILGFILIIAGLILFLFTHKKTQREVSPAKDTSKDKNTIRQMRFFVIFAFSYLGLLPVLGYSLSTIIWVVFMSYLAGEKRWPKLLIISLAITIGGYYLFWRILYIPLPVGMVERALGLDFIFYGD